MRVNKLIYWLIVVMGVSLAGFQLQAQPEPVNTNNTPVLRVAPPPAQQAPEEKAEGLPPSAGNVWKNLPITNSMLVTWIVAIIVIVFARSATKNIKQVPDGAQNFWELLVEGLYNFLGEITGPDLIKKSFWFFATIFIFICFTNWFGLIPGVGTIGRGHDTAHGFVVDHPMLRGGNADLNMTSAMAMIFMLLWLVWALQSNGIWGFILHIFGPKGESQGAMKYAMIVIFFCVGLIEVMSIAFRPISLSFRLFGNIFAGENLLEAMSNIIQHPAWARHVFAAALPIPFYFMELLVGFVQAVVFMLLTAGFTAVICMHDDPHEKGHH